MACTGIAAWLMMVNPVIDRGRQEPIELFIETSVEFDVLSTNLSNTGAVRNLMTIKLLSKAMQYTGDVGPGHYLLKPGLSALDLIRKFRSGSQDPVRITFNGIRLREDLASMLGRQLALDSADIMELFNDEHFLMSLGFRIDDALCLFIPNTYEVYWTITPVNLFKRMQKEYDVFWNPKRKQKAADAGLIPVEVSILASIVQEETKKLDEMPRVAGVYINRLNKGMALKADPTVKFATRNFGIRRVLESDLAVSSPYNTYLVTGLPPGPICLPELQTIDRVLDFEKHSYLYLCARPDYSGYHNFAKTGEQHIQNANIYRSWLNKEGILR